MELDKEQRRVCDCSDAWVAISVFRASISPEGRGGGYEVGRALKEAETGGRRMENVIREQSHRDVQLLFKNI